jgi:3-deoxy-D-manno-octulosonic-acid transferase
MRLVYGIAMRLLWCAMWLAARFNAKAAKWIEGRRQDFRQLRVPDGKQVAWFHCASLGEFDQGLPVMNAYKEKFPDSFVVVTFFSPSGMENYNRREHRVDLALYMPLDTGRNARNFVMHFHPEQAFFVKYEFWYNHLLAAKRSGARVYGVSSLFRPSHRFFKWYGGFFRKALRLFDRFYVQDERSAALLRSVGIDRVVVSGDTRYDRMIAVRENNSGNAAIEDFRGNDKLIILGSSWPVDEELFAPVARELIRDYKLLIAPHDIGESHIAQIEKLFQGETIRYSAYESPEKRILILDTIGHLTSAYRYGDLAYVGGGFTGKLHNILEPGAFGLPVIFGPKHERFPEAQLFIDRGVAVSLRSNADLLPAIESLMCRRTKIGAELETIFKENAGAAKKAVAETGSIAP